MLKWTTLVLAVPWLTGCEGPHSALDPASPMARDVARVWWAMFVVGSTVWLAVSALWVYALARTPREREEAHARRINRRWVIGGGIVLPTVSIALLLLWGLPTGRSMLPLPLIGQQPLRIDVTGNQWWWEVHYPEAGVTTANHFVLPAGRPVDVHVTSRDVIHSFWVPRLGGKMDMIPGRVNVIRLEAERPGEYHGQCSEFCGTQHARMKLPTLALAEEDFATWLARRQQLRFAAPAGAAGELFDQRCGQCHRVAGVSDGQRAPDLTDLASRPSLGAGTLANTPDNLRRWLREHQTLKAGNAMPIHDEVDDNTLEQLAAWLETLAP